MKTRIVAIGFLMISVILCSKAIKKESDNSSNVDAQERVLIAHGSTDYEKKVTEIIEAKLGIRGAEIKTIDVAHVDSEDPEKFNAILLMHAVEENMLKESVKQLLKRTPTGYEGPWPYIMISTVTGRNWISKDSSVDGITAATKIQQAEGVARKIIGRVTAILEGKYR